MVVKFLVDKTSTVWHELPKLSTSNAIYSIEALSSMSLVSTVVNLLSFLLLWSTCSKMYACTGTEFKMENRNNVDNGQTLQQVFGINKNLATN